jgi:hypothetical protein
MRAALFLAVVLAAHLGLSACATGRDLPTYKQEMDKLDAECVARGGILTPSGRQTGRPQTDYVCKISGGASRIPQY